MLQNFSKQKNRQSDEGLAINKNRHLKLVPEKGGEQVLI